MGLFDKIKPKWKHKESKVRLKALRELENPDTIFKMAENDPSSEIRIKAIKRIMYGPGNIAKSDDLYLKYEPKLIAIAKNDSDVEVRKEAIRNIKNKDALADIVDSDPVTSVRELAFNNLTDPDVFISIVKNNSDTHIRKRAIREINSHAFHGLTLMQ